MALWDIFGLISPNFISKVIKLPERAICNFRNYIKSQISCKAMRLTITNYVN